MNQDQLAQLFSRQPAQGVRRHEAVEDVARVSANPGMVDKLMGYVEAHPDCLASDISRGTGMSVSAFSSMLTKLSKSGGRLTRTQTNRGYRYRTAP